MEKLLITFSMLVVATAAYSDTLECTVTDNVEICDARGCYIIDIGPAPKP